MAILVLNQSVKAHGPLAMLQKKILVTKGSDNFLSTVNTMTAQTVVPDQCKNAWDIWPNYDSSTFMKLKTKITTVQTSSSRQSLIWSPWPVLHMCMLNYVWFKTIVSSQNMPCTYQLKYTLMVQYADGFSGCFSINTSCQAVFCDAILN